MRSSDARRSTMGADQVRGTFPFKTKFTGGAKRPGTEKMVQSPIGSTGAHTDLTEMDIEAQWWATFRPKVAG
ncbi:unnamed protein product [Phytophthora fragariaefolia]|uniref:Unnamed protein product n=1 Tax=Phytophthora fragariaefolia TaxID=1490495 RepID=A0A9W7CNA0_9STRA|nr:unnamed protein product [Phytophthora fragariaefolia]